MWIVICQHMLWRRYMYLKACYIHTYLQLELSWHCCSIVDIVEVQVNKFVCSSERFFSTSFVLCGTLFSSTSSVELFLHSMQSDGNANVCSQDRGVLSCFYSQGNSECFSFHTKIMMYTVVTDPWYMCSVHTDFQFFFCDRSSVIVDDFVMLPSQTSQSRKYYVD